MRSIALLVLLFATLTSCEERENPGHVSRTIERFNNPELVLHTMLNRVLLTRDSHRPVGQQEYTHAPQSGRSINIAHQDYLRRVMNEHLELLQESREDELSPTSAPVENWHDRMIIYSERCMNKSLLSKFSMCGIRNVEYKQGASFPLITELILNLNLLSDWNREISTMLPNVKILNLDDNLFTSFNFEKFEPLLNLEKISARSNLIEYVHTGKARVSFPSLYEVVLSDNSIWSIGQEVFAVIPELRSLDLSNNKIQSLPYNFLFSNRKLEILLLSNNQLRHLRIRMFVKKMALHRFEAKNNNLGCLIIEKIFCLPQIKTLDLSDNPLFDEYDVSPIVCINKLEIPEKAAEDVACRYGQDCIQITPADARVSSLSPSGNEMILTTNSVKLANTGLKMIDFSGNKFRENGVYVHVMSLQHNPIKELKVNNFEYFENLMEIHLGNCQITTIEDYTFHALTKLEILNLNDNLILNVDFIKGLASAVYLDISRTNIQLPIPDGIPVRITGISVAGQKSRTDINIKDYCQITGLKELDLSHNSESEICFGMDDPNQCHLEKLDLSYNKLSELPDNFEQSMVKMKELSLTHCQFFEIKLNKFCRMKALTHINMSHNEITSVMYYDGDDDCAIRSLDLSGNSIGSLHEEHFSKFTNLQYLYLGGNLIEEICFNCLQWAMRGLLKMDLSGNPITGIRTHPSTFEHYKLELFNVAHPMKELKIVYWSLENSVKCLSAMGTLEKLELYRSSSPEVGISYNTDLCDKYASNENYNDGLGGLKELTLRGATELPEQDSFVDMYSLSKWTVTEGNLPTVSLDMFALKAKNIRELYLSGNNILSVSSTFLTKIFLHTTILDLSNNPILDLEFTRHLNLDQFIYLLLDEDLEAFLRPETTTEEIEEENQAAT